MVRIDGARAREHGGKVVRGRLLTAAAGQAQIGWRPAGRADLMWSDPEDIDTWAVSPRGAGWLFGCKVTSEVCLAPVRTSWV